MKTTNKHQIFRRNAIKHYLQNMEKDTFPRFVSLPTFLFLWVLLTLFLILGAVAWNTKIPIYVSAPGVVINTTRVTTVHHKKEAANNEVAVLFLQPQQAQRLHKGLPVNLTVSGTGPQLSGIIDSIGSSVISPATAYTRYQLNKSAIAVTQPTIVLTVRLPNFATTNYVGSALIGQIQTSSQSILSLLPVVGNTFKS
jgi:hypothetical protein